MSVVGVFDSGVGGLTVLRNLQKLCPMCDFLYLADHAFCPYGTKSADAIRNRALSVARHLYSCGAQSIVIACNTASVFADDLRAAVPVPIFDVIAPTCSVVALSGYRRVAVLATTATIQSGVYQCRLHRYGVQAIGYICDSFVSLVESSADYASCQCVVQNALATLPQQHFDAVVLGCTHFPLLANHIAWQVGCPLVDCSLPVAQLFASKNPPQGSGSVQYLTTGNVGDASRAAAPFGVSFVGVDLR